MINRSGKVLGVVFGAAVDDVDTGFVLTAQEVSRQMAKVGNPAGQTIVAFEVALCSRGDGREAGAIGLVRAQDDAGARLIPARQRLRRHQCCACRLASIASKSLAAAVTAACGPVSLKNTMPCGPSMIAPSI